MKIHVALGYWCEDTWVIAAGESLEAVTRDADAYMAKYPATYKDGHFIHQDPNGRCASGYTLDEIESSK